MPIPRRRRRRRIQIAINILEIEEAAVLDET